MNTHRIYTILDGLQERKISLGDFLRVRPYTILYFYPKDSTPGCTLEAQDFTRLHKEFEVLRVGILGVSRDTMEGHARFVHDCHLGIPLVSDTDGSLHDAFGVIGTKKLYGVERVGVIRSTFLLDNSGNIVKEWRNVKATGHADKILAYLRETLK